ncbi:MAG: hypothetical protein HY225_01705 [Candidatus Vogelbacteria bacterium]|nr:hypothetical protein [Candidatus Vogelbacteria bacterium]
MEKSFETKKIEKEVVPDVTLSYVNKEGITIKYPDPYTSLVSKIESQKIASEKMIRTEESAVVNVDLFQDAFRNGGLPLLRGNETLDRVRKSDAENLWGVRMDSIDLHSKDNIGNAIAHGLPLFSQLFLDKSGDVAVVFEDKDGQHKMDYGSAKMYSAENGLANKESAAFSKDEVEKYLKDQRDFRIFTAAILNFNEPNDLGQMLWPLHAVNDDTESSYLGSTEDDEKPELVVFKGGKVQGKDGRKTDSYAAFLAADGSVVNITNEGGYGNTPTDVSAGSVFSNLVETRGMKNIIGRGLAFTHCNKFTMENLRTMQELAKLEDKIKNGEIEGARVFFHKRLSDMSDKLNDLGIIDLATEEDRMVTSYDKYIAAGLKLDPAIKIAMHIGHSDPVRLPNVPEAAQSGFLNSVVADYERMGVEIISDNYLV